ncbi:Uncharacterised protein [Mycobacteroides abscessus subsp. abscessus]|nr:Uncharacterised protein [Mycobacteroides abscessus subsp. abscessus]
MSDPRCQFGDRCVARTPDGPAAVILFPLCAACVDDVQKCIDQLPQYRYALEHFKKKAPGTGLQTRVASSSEPSTPLDVRVVDLIDRIDTLAHRLCGFVGVLARNVVSNHGVVMAADIRSVWSQAEDICGFQRVWQRRHGPCPECGLPTLGGWVGDELIRCTNSGCAAVLTKGKYEEHCELTAKRA